MNRPIAVDAVRIAEHVTSGVVEDRLRTVVRRYGADPVDDPQWLLEQAYAYAQVPRLCLSVHRLDVQGATAQERILACARALLSPNCEWILDPDRMTEIHDRENGAMITAAVLMEQWLPDRAWRWEVSSPFLGAPLAFADQGRGPVDRRTPCPVPQAVLDHAFAGIPHVAHLARESGNRKLNLRFGLTSSLEIEPHRESPVNVLRILSVAPPTVRRGATA